MPPVSAPSAYSPTGWFTGSIDHKLATLGTYEGGPGPATGKGLPRREQGAVLVEFALMVPLFLALVLGIFTGGTAYYQKISIVEAVREGGRFGASLPLGSGVGALVAWEDAVRARVVEASAGELEPTDVCVTLVLPAGGSECGVPDPPGAAGEPAVHLVKVSASRPSSIQFFFFDTDVDLNGSIAARFERDTG